MAALTSLRNTKSKAGDQRSFLIAANVKIYAGSIVVIEAGYAKPGKTATALSTVGIACQNYDNTGGAAGAFLVSVQTSGGDRDYLMANDTTAPVVQTGVGFDCYVLDDQTVTSDATGRSVAGKALRLENGQVWVRFPI